MRSPSLHLLVRGSLCSSLSLYAIPVVGIAACNIGGVTIHSFAGIGLGIEKAEELAKRVRINKKASSRWLRTKVLIIDESWCTCSSFSQAYCDRERFLWWKRTCSIS